jgi:hypothetical protein
MVAALAFLVVACQLEVAGAPDTRGAPGEPKSVRDLLADRSSSVDSRTIEAFFDLDVRCPAKDQGMVYEPRVSGNVQRFQTDDGALLDVDPATGRLVTYLSSHPSEEDASPAAPRISREEALATADALLQRLGSDARVDSDAYVRPDPGAYSIRVYRTYMGYKCMSSSVSVRISMHSGKVTGFLDHPFVLPRSVERKIDREQALQIATKHVSSKWACDASLVSISEPALYIAWADPQHGSDASLQEPGARPKLVWFVVCGRPANGESRLRGGTLMIDARTGGVLTWSH